MFDQCDAGTAVLQALLAFSLPPLSWRGRVPDILLFAIGAISGPFCLLLLPCIAAWWWNRRQRWTIVVMGITFLGALLQVLTILHSARARQAALGVTPLRLLRIMAGSIFIDSMTGTGGPYLRVSLLIVAAIGGLTIMVWSWRSARLGRLYISFAILVLLRMPAGPSAAARNHPSLGSACERYWNPLLVPALTYVSLVRGVVRVGRRERVGAALGLAVLLLTLVGVYREWDATRPWPASHWSADVAGSKALNLRGHMIFQVYDPGGRTMELIRAMMTRFGNETAGPSRSAALRFLPRCTGQGHVRPSVEKSCAEY